MVAAARSLPTDIGLKCRRVFAEIVQQAGKLGGVAAAKFIAELARQRRDLLEMLEQRLPVRAV